MKFSDMMGKRDRANTDVTEPQLPPEATAAPPVPDAPIRFGGNRSEFDEAVAVFGGSVNPPTAPPPLPIVPAPPPAPAASVMPVDTVPTPLVTAPVPPMSAPQPVSAPQPSIHEVMAELAPRAAQPTAVTDQQLDTSAWLDGISSIDDDLLPR